MTLGGSVHHSYHTGHYHLHVLSCLQFSLSPQHADLSTSAPPVSPLAHNGLLTLGTHSPICQATSQAAERMVSLMCSHPQVARPEIPHYPFHGLKSLFKILDIVHKNTDRARKTVGT